MTTETEKKTDFVMVTFGVKNAALKRKFNRLWKKSNTSRSALARDLISESIDRRLSRSK